MFLIDHSNVWLLQTQRKNFSQMWMFYKFKFSKCSLSYLHLQTWLKTKIYSSCGKPCSCHALCNFPSRNNKIDSGEKVQVFFLEVLKSKISSHLSNDSTSKASLWPHESQPSQYATEGLFYIYMCAYIIIICVWGEYFH